MEHGVPRGSSPCACRWLMGSTTVHIGRTPGLSWHRPRHNRHRSELVRASVGPTRTRGLDDPDSSS